jgi:CDP-diacylglycerol--serine O-phosphatidyltransferase
MFKDIIAQVPNTITCLNLISGCVAIALAFAGNYEGASVAIFAAAVFDFMDGAVARLMKAYSAVGKELDSLSDLVSFGVAPAAMLYNVLPADYSWIALAVPVCGALRLARFNVDSRQSTSFIGMPIPANALLWVGAVAWYTSLAHPEQIPDWMAICAVGLGAQTMLDPIQLVSLKFKDFKLTTENVLRYVVIVVAIVSVLLLGLPGLSLTVLIYYCLGLIYPFLP